MKASVSVISDQSYESDSDANYFIPGELGCNLEGDRWRSPVDVCSSCSLNQTDHWLAIVATLAFYFWENFSDDPVKLFHPSALAKHFSLRRNR